MTGTDKKDEVQARLENQVGLELGKHAECYQAGEDNLSVIQGMVELRG
jgi:hypothetical protein